MATHQAEQSEIVLYHLGLPSDSCPVEKWKDEFGHVKVVCIGGTPSRMRNLAENFSDKTGQTVRQVSEKQDRFSMFICQSVMFCSHGIGMPSMSVLLHELVKLLRRAGSENFVILRVGTSGGVGVEAGGIVVTDKAIDTQLRQKHQMGILGQEVLFDCEIDQRLLQRIRRVAETNSKFGVIFGTTLAANDFYEEQARLDGAVCEITDKQRIEFLKRIYSEHGVRNFEMESTQLVALTNRMGVKATSICVCLLNRFHGDSIKLTTEDFHNFEAMLGEFVLKVVDDLLEKPVD